MLTVEQIKDFNSEISSTFEKLKDIASRCAYSQINNFDYDFFMIDGDKITFLYYCPYDESEELTMLLKYFAKGGIELYESEVLNPRLKLEKEIEIKDKEDRHKKYLKLKEEFEDDQRRDKNVKYF